MYDLFLFSVVAQDFLTADIFQATKIRGTKVRSYSIN